MIYLIKGQDTPHTNPAHYVLAQNWRKTGVSAWDLHLHWQLEDSCCFNCCGISPTTYSRTKCKIPVYM